MMKRNMYYVVALIAGTGLLVVLLCFWPHQEERTRPTGDVSSNRSGHAVLDSSSQEKQKSYDKLISSDGRKLFGNLKDQNGRMVARDSRTWMFGVDGLSYDAPQVELRFYERSEDGKLKPRLVRYIAFHTEDGGKPNELSGMVFETYDGFLGAWAFRLYVAPEGKEPDRFHGLFSGKEYEVSITKVRNGSGTGGEPKRVSRKVTIPTEVPRGKVAVLRMDLTEKKKQRRLKVQVRAEELSDKGTYRVFCANRGSDVGSAYRYITLKSGDTASLSVSKLGGEVVVYNSDAFGKGPGTLASYYVRDMQKSINLPEDADIAFHSKDLVSFRLNLPSNEIPEGVDDIGLLVEADDKIPVTYVSALKRPQLKDFDTPEQYANAMESPHTWDVRENVRMEIVPGQYYVGYELRKAIGYKILGKIHVTSQDGGQSVSVRRVKGVVP